MSKYKRSLMKVNESNSNEEDSLLVWCFIKIKITTIYKIGIGTLKGYVTRNNGRDLVWQMERVWWIFSSQISRQREDHVYKCPSVILTNADESHDWFLSSVRSRHSIAFKCLHLPLFLSKYGNNFFQIGHYTVQSF